MGSLETQMADKVEFSVGDVAGDVDDVGRVKVYNGNEVSDISVWRLKAQTDQEREVLNGLKQTALSIGFTALRSVRRGYVIPGGVPQLGRIIDFNTIQR
jgi:hypothetical protein